VGELLGGKVRVAMTTVRRVRRERKGLTCVGGVFLGFWVVGGGRWGGGGVGRYCGGRGNAGGGGPQFGKRGRDLLSQARAQ